MSIEYRYAKQSDLENVLRLEKSYFVTEESPPETKEGLELFLNLEGKILLQVDNNQVVGCIELIPIKKLEKKILLLPETSPLRHVYTFAPERYVKSRDALLVHGWINNGHPAKWLYKRLFKDFDKKEMIGFALIKSETLRFYLSLGCEILDITPKLYCDNDAHYIILLNRDLNV